MNASSAAKQLAEKLVNRRLGFERGAVFSRAGRYFLTTSGAAEAALLKGQRPDGSSANCKSGFKNTLSAVLEALRHQNQCNIEVFRRL